MSKNVYEEKSLSSAKNKLYKWNIYLWSCLTREPILFAIQKIGPTLTNQGIFV